MLLFETISTYYTEVSDFLSSAETRTSFVLIIILSIASAMLGRIGLKYSAIVGPCRSLKAPLSTTAAKLIFNRPLKAKQRVRASQLTDYQYYEYLREEMASRLIDRLEDISRPFPVALELGSHTGIFGRKISEGDSVRSSAGGIGGIEKLLQTDMAMFGSHSENRQVMDVNALFANAVGDKVKIANLPLDEEHIALPENTFDLVVSNSNLHWVNDIPKTLKEVQRVLKPDGAFIATMLGGATLQELRHSFFLADQERKGGTGQHASPMALASDMAALMQAANFSLPTVDVDTIQVRWNSVVSCVQLL